MAITDIDEQKLEQFIGLAATEVGAALNVALVTLGDELGLYRAMADGQPVTPQELADRTGTQERYIREWLNAQAASGFVAYTDNAYVLPPEHALVLADETSPFSMHGTFQSANAAVAIRERLVDKFTEGDGVGWHEHHHDLWHGTERAFATAYRTHLLAEWLPALDGVVAKLEAGALVADVGCGHGASTILLAEAFPASHFVGDRLPRRLDLHRAQPRGRGGRRRPRDASRSPARPTTPARATTSSRSSTRSTTSATRSPPRATRRRCSPPAAR